MPDTATEDAIASQSISQTGEALPSVSVVIVARDAEEYLREALDSILCQTEPPDEVVVFDDGSVDKTRRIAESYQSKIARLFILSTDESVGISAARNRANGSVTSDFIAVLDADDLLTSKAIALYRKTLRENPELDLLYADTCVFSSTPATGTPFRYPRFSNSRNAIRRILASPRVPIKHSSILYRRDSFDRLGGYDESRKIKVDIDLFLKFLESSLFVKKLDATTSFHRKHPRQVSTRRMEGLRAYFDLTRRYESNPLLRPALLVSRSLAEIGKMLLRG